MARLSRTNKFADLREQMSNDRETSVYTDQLSGYQDRLKTVQNNANGSYEDVLNRQDSYSQNQFQTPPVYQQPVVNQTPAYADPFNNKQAIGTNNYFEQAPTYEAPKVPSFETQNNPFVEPVKMPSYQAPTAPTFDAPKVPSFETQNNPFAEPIKSPNYEIPKAPTYEAPKAPSFETQNNPFAEPIKTPNFESPSFSNNNVEANKGSSDDDFFSFLNNLDTVNLDKDIRETIDKVPMAEFADVKPMTAPPIKEEVKPTINNDFLTNAIKEVDDYNRQDGRQTINELPSSMVDAVRHPELNNLASKDDQFSSTVSLEIDKVLSDIKPEPFAVNNPQSAVQAEPPIANTQTFVAPQTPTAEFQQPNPQPNLGDTIQQPVFAEPVANDGLEIKSMEETLKQEVLDDTIPFVMNSDDETDEEYEEEAPNKILNVILVVLIVILLAILGVIVYYILYAKGIIG